MQPGTYIIDRRKFSLRKWWQLSRHKPLRFLIAILIVRNKPNHDRIRLPLDLLATVCEFTALSPDNQAALATEEVWLQARGWHRFLSKQGFPEGTSIPIVSSPALVMWTDPARSTIAFISTATTTAPIIGSRRSTTRTLGRITSRNGWLSVGTNVSLEDDPLIISRLIRDAGWDELLTALDQLEQDKRQHEVRRFSSDADLRDAWIACNDRKVEGLVQRGHYVRIGD